MGGPRGLLGAFPYPMPEFENRRVIRVCKTSVHESVNRRKGTEFHRSTKLFPFGLPKENRENAILRPLSLETDLRQVGGWSRVDYRGWCSRQEVAAIMG